MRWMNQNLMKNCPVIPTVTRGDRETPCFSSTSPFAVVGVAVTALSSGLLLA